jgi:activator-of-BECN1-regulated-autophagy protein 1
VIASLSFHPDGMVLAISSGHKLFMWRYNERGTAGSPVLALRCRHSLRAVHFHPGSQPVLLAAEVRGPIPRGEYSENLAATGGSVRKAVRRVAIIDQSVIFDTQAFNA